MAASVCITLHLRGAAATDLCRRTLGHKWAPPQDSSARRFSLWEGVEAAAAGRKNKKQGAVVRALGGGGQRIPSVDRVIAASSYFLPLLDGMQYGRFLFAQFPTVEHLFQPLFPLLRLYSSIPYSNFVVFFSIYLALVRNPRFSRYVRFNAMQACVLDVLIVIPIIIQRILSPRSGFGLELLILSYNAIFASLLIAVVFGVVSCILGKTPRLPIVAEAADNQLF